MAEKRNLKNATRYFKAALAGTLLASVGNAYTFDVINAEDSVDSNGDVKVEELLQINNVLNDKTFLDVRSNYWALDSVKWAVAEGLLKVDENGMFRPNDLLTESEFAHALVHYYRMHDVYLGGANLYNDHWADDAYVKLSKYGVPMLGYDMLYFRDKPVRRGLFAQAISYVNGNTEDIDEAVKYLFDLGLTQGWDVTSNNLLMKFGIGETLTRAQASVFLHRMHNKGIVDNKVSVDDTLHVDEQIKENIKKVDEQSLSKEEKEAKKKAEEKAENKSNNNNSSNKDTGKKENNNNNSKKEEPVNKNPKPSNPKPSNPPVEKPDKPVDKKPDPKPEIVTKTTTETQSVAFKTVEQKDPTLEKGKTKVVQNGKNGVRTITYKEVYENGKLKSKEQISSKITTQPVDKIVKVGTKEPEKPKPNPGNPADLVSGVYSQYGMNVADNGNGYVAAGGGREHVYTGSYMLVKFTGDYSTFDIASQALGKLGRNINVRSGAEQLANSGKMEVTINGVRFSIQGQYVEVRW